MKFTKNFFLVAFVCFSSSLSTIWGKNKNVGNSFNIEDWSQADKKLATYLIEIYHKTTDAQRGFLLHFENAQQMFNEIKKENTVSSSPDQSHYSTEQVEHVENVENVKHMENIETKEENEKNEKKQGKERKEEAMYKSDGAISLNSIELIPQEHMVDSSPSPSPSSSPSSSSSPAPSSSPRFVQLKAKGPVEEETIWRAIYATQLRRTPPTANVNVYSEENIEKEFDLAKMDAYTSEIARMKIEFEKNLNYMSKELVRQRKIKETLKEVLLLEVLIKNLENKNKKYYNKGGPIMRGSDATKTEC